ncbi:MAG: hypothetical protein MUF57_01915 [Gammaproteobacteria bacterium]|nr:hypothetical protein [Gammaproteobacteria bacterium]
MASETDRFEPPPHVNPADEQQGATRDPYDFSVVLGGPLYQLVRRAHLAGDALELLRRRVVVISLFAWLPLLVLSALGGQAWGDAVPVPFLMDIEAHARFLGALPLLIIAELVVHQRMRPVARQFLERGLIPDTARARFDAALASAQRLRNSMVAELALVAIVYLVGIFYVWPQYIALHVATWYATPTANGQDLSMAGWWFVGVSLPIFQFILLRWYFRLFIWIRFLWQVSRCQLSLMPAHPDRTAGLGFLSMTVVAFAPILAAHGVLVAGTIANQIFFEGAKLLDFKLELAAIVVFLLLLVLGPLLLFTPQLAAARRAGLRHYGTLAQRYAREFEAKWLRGGAAPGEPLLGSGDIQSLADLGNSFEIVRSTRVLPFTRDAVLQLGLITLLPVTPLVLTMIPLEELMTRLLQILL